MSPDPKTHFYLETRGNDFALQECKASGGFEDVLITPIGQKGFYQICAYMQDYFFSKLGKEENPNE